MTLAAGMTWIVRCPQCKTIYKLVPDQVKIAQAWVRCGQCQHAFDSTGLVVIWPEADVIKERATDQLAGDERLVIGELLKQEDRSGAELKSVATVSAFEEALASFKPQPLPAQPDAPDAGSADANDHSQSGGAPSEQSTSSVGRTPAWMPKLGAFFLLLVLVLQGLWIERHTLAAVDPRFARVWETVCQAWACEITAQSVRDGVVIDSSSLTPLAERGFLLRWSWRNTTSQPLQTPALELTLLSAQDKAVLRRVIPVADLGAPASLAAGQTWDGQLQLMPEDGLMPPGYRLFSFYP